MSEIRHTPGPWQWDDEKVWEEGYDTEQHAPWLVGPEGERILTGQIHCLSEHDGRLIAAAPELLEALQTMVQFADSPDFNGAPSNAAYQQARAAIAKARSQP